jgi:hypothetical protein
MHDIIGDIVDWDEANKVYLAVEGVTGERYSQRLEAADKMAEIEARWQHLPGGFHGQRKLIKVHIQAVADSAQTMSSEERCWLAIAAASAWLPKSASVEQVVAGDEPRGPRPTRDQPRSSQLYKNQPLPIHPRW